MPNLEGGTYCKQIEVTESKKKKTNFGLDGNLASGRQDENAFLTPPQLGDSS